MSQFQQRMDIAQKKQDFSAIFTNLRKHGLKETEKSLIKELEKFITKTTTQKTSIDVKQDVNMFLAQYLQFIRDIDACPNHYKFTLNVLRFFIYIFYYLKIMPHNLQIANDILKKLMTSQELFFQPAIKAFNVEPNSNALKLNLLKNRVTIFISSDCKKWLNQYFEDHPSDKNRRAVRCEFYFQRPDQK